TVIDRHHTHDIVFTLCRRHDRLVVNGTR
ncbi:hypothetical protein D043_2633B, partial [Vibrio parahaemolyticus EKP-021]